ncbi:MAG: SGNH/GDSL hydrolase family protein [Desulfobacteraceae bacterium]
MGQFKSTLLLKKGVSFFVFLFIMFTGNAFAEYDAVVAFGDSLTDHGGLQHYLGAYDPFENPNGVRAVWSNGDTWVEYFADELDATLDNNAIAGAMTDGHENEGIQALSDADQLPDLGLIGQVATYIDSDPTFIPSTTLFTIWIGGNDLLEFAREESYTADAVVLISGAMTNIQTAITNLRSNGAVNFLILNLPDLGSTPYFNTLSANEKAAATAISNSYNAALSNLVTSLRANMTGITIHYFDVFSYMNTMIDDEVFANVTDTYMTLDEDGDYTGAVNGDAEDYLFWDLIHPTTRAHEYVGIEVADSVLAEEAEEDDSTCFISTVGNQAANPINANILSLFGLMFIMVGTGFSIRKNKR